MTKGGAIVCCCKGRTVRAKPPLYSCRAPPFLFLVPVCAPGSVLCMYGLCLNAVESKWWPILRVQKLFLVSKEMQKVRRAPSSL